MLRDVVSPQTPRCEWEHTESCKIYIIATVWEEAEGSIQSLTNLKGEESQKSQVMFTGKCCGPREKRKLSARWPWYGLEGLAQSGPCELSELTRTIPTMRRKCREQNPNWVRTRVMAAKERDNLNKEREGDKAKRSSKKQGPIPNASRKQQKEEP